MDVEPVRDLTGRPAHPLVHPGEVDGDVGMVDGAGIEERVHQTEPVELALPVGAGAVLERVPDGAHAPDVVGHPSGRPVEGHREAALDVRPYLGAEPEVEPAPAPPLEVPRDLGHRERAPRERDRDVGADLEPAGGARRKGEGQERVVARLEGPRAVEAHALEAKPLLPHPLEGHVPHLGVDLHSVLSLSLILRGSSRSHAVRRGSMTSRVNWSSPRRSPSTSWAGGLTTKRVTPRAA